MESTETYYVIMYLALAFSFLILIVAIIMDINTRDERIAKKQARREFYKQKELQRLKEKDN